MAWDTGLDRDSAAYKFAADDSKDIRVGADKTLGLRRRIERLLEQGQDPCKILALTYTRKAAQSLRNEMQAAGVNGSDKVAVMTLNSFCFELLSNDEIIDITGRFPRALFKFEQKPMLYDISSSFGDFYSNKKRLQALTAGWARLQSEDAGSQAEIVDRQFEQKVLTWLKNHKAMLFGETAIETFRYLRNNPECAERNGFDHILVDEYGDFNKAEQAIIDLLASNCSIAVIGDEDQSAGQPVSAPEAKQESTDTSPRCDIVDFGKWDSSDEEINEICNKVCADILNSKVRPADVQIFAPARKIGNKIRDMLVQKGIDAKAYFRESAISTDDLKYSFALLTLMTNPNDRVALRYLLGFGSHDYHASSYRRLLDHAVKNGTTALDILEGCVMGNLKVANISPLVKQCEKIIKQIEDVYETVKGDPDAWVDAFAKDIPENTDFRNIFIEAVAEAKNVQKAGLEAWLIKLHSCIAGQVSYPESISGRDHVRIMSLNAAKGFAAALHLSQEKEQNFSKRTVLVFYHVNQSDPYLTRRGNNCPRNI